MFERQLTQKSLLSQAVFMLVDAQNFLDQLEHKLKELFCPHAQLKNYVDSC